MNKMERRLLLIWKEPISRQRYIIGKLTAYDDYYQFEYVNPQLDDALKSGFTYYPGFSELNKIYKSEKLFDNVLTRLPNKSRSDYLEIMNSYDLSSNASDFDILTRTKGRLLTDNYEFVPDFNPYKIEFDIAGTKYSSDIQRCKDKIHVNDKLYLELDLNNKKDSNAVKVIYKDMENKYELGYVPRYYSAQLKEYIDKGINYSAMVQNINFESEFFDENVTASVKILFENI